MTEGRRVTPSYETLAAFMNYHGHHVAFYGLAGELETPDPSLSFTIRRATGDRAVVVFMPREAGVVGTRTEKDDGTVVFTFTIPANGVVTRT